MIAERQVIFWLRQIHEKATYREPGVSYMNAAAVISEEADFLDAMLKVVPELCEVIETAGMLRRVAVPLQPTGLKGEAARRYDKAMYALEKKSRILGSKGGDSASDADGSGLA